jgi:hypothetical protein
MLYTNNGRTDAFSQAQSNPSLRIPHISRVETLRTIRYLSDKSLSASITQIGIECNITEILVVCAARDTKDIVVEALKTNPYSIKETSRDVFRIGWKLGWQ